MDKPPLFIGALHGDEKLGVEALKKVEKELPPKEYKYRWIVGNPKALKKGVRYIDKDLNRVAPGNKNSKDYEKKRAYELVKLSKNHSFLIDIHTTNADCGIFIIITNPTIENFILAASLPVEKVVVWASSKPTKSGPITQFAHCPSVEIECGPKAKTSIKKDLSETINKVIKNKNPRLSDVFANISKQKYYVVEGVLKNVDTKGMKDFKKAKINGEVFYPLLVDSYEKGSVRKMKKLNLFDILAYQQ